MGLIAVDRAAAGMVLHANVVDLRGRLLIPAGKELSDKHVAALPMWGVTHIEIEGPAPEAVRELSVDPEMLAMAESEVAKRFANAGTDHPFLTELRRICVERSANELARRAQVSP